MLEIVGEVDAALSEGLLSEGVVGAVATVCGVSDSPFSTTVGGLEVGEVFCVLVEFLGRGIGLTASSPNCASRNIRRRDSLVEGSGVL